MASPASPAPSACGESTDFPSIAPLAFAGYTQGRASTSHTSPLLPPPPMLSLPFALSHTSVHLPVARAPSGPGSDAVLVGSADTGCGAHMSSSMASCRSSAARSIATTRLRSSPLGSPLFAARLGALPGALCALTSAGLLAGTVPVLVLLAGTVPVLVLLLRGAPLMRSSVAKNAMLRSILRRRALRSAGSTVVGREDARMEGSLQRTKGEHKSTKTVSRNDHASKRWQTCLRRSVHFSHSMLRSTAHNTASPCCGLYCKQYCSSPHPSGAEVPPGLGHCGKLAVHPRFVLTRLRCTKILCSTGWERVLSGPFVHRVQCHYSRVGRDPSTGGEETSAQSRQRSWAARAGTIVRAVLGVRSRDYGHCLLAMTPHREQQGTHLAVGLRTRPVPVGVVPRQRVYSPAARAAHQHLVRL